MLGLIFVAVAVVYIVVSIVFVIGVVVAARKQGIKGWKFGVPAALIMYLLVFWDHVPTLLLHKYYCETEAGSWVFKSSDEWLAENNVNYKSVKWFDNYKVIRVDDFTVKHKLGNWFERVITKRNNLILPLTITEYSIVDIVNNDKISKEVHVSAGYGLLSHGGKSSWKVWMDIGHCGPLLGESMGFLKEIRGK